MKCEGTLFLDGNPFTKISDATEISFDNAEIPEYISDVRISNPAAAELSLEGELNVDLFKQLTGVNLLQNNFVSGCSLELKSPRPGRQIRRHRKRRINKKWAKRYGYTTEFESITLRDCTIKSHDDGIFDIMGY